MDVFYHNLYEYQKGLRHLCLCTLPVSDRERVLQRLDRENVSSLVHDIGEGKINVYFGDKPCVEVVKSFRKINLSELEPAEDFILGIMLGYDRLKQCERYLFKFYMKKSLEFS